MLKILGPVVVIAIMSLAVYSVWVTIAWRTTLRRLKGLDDWRAWLPRSERIKFARERLEDVLQEQDYLHQNRLNKIISNPLDDTQEREKQL